MEEDTDSSKDIFILNLFQTEELIETNYLVDNFLVTRVLRAWRITYIQYTLLMSAMETLLIAARGSSIDNK